MTPSELLELAGIVYPEVKWIRCTGGAADPFAEVVAWVRESKDDPNNIYTYFNPSLTGEDWQVAQACRVIVAAFALDGPFQITGQDDHHFGVRLYSAHYRFEKDGIRLMGNTGPEHDILTASAKALIASRGNGENA